jgi:hypothetical protein
MASNGTSWFCRTGLVRENPVAELVHGADGVVGARHTLPPKVVT